MRESPFSFIKLQKAGASQIGDQESYTYHNDRVATQLFAANYIKALTSGTPLEFFNQCRLFSSRGSRVQADDPVSLAEDWGLPPRIWHEEWSQASGGESQRAMLAISICLKPDILLLDEPTSYHFFRRLKI